MTTTTNRPWILRWPALTLLTGVVTASAYQFLAAFQVAGIGAEGDIGGGAVWLLGILLIVTGATAAVAARPRRPASTTAEGRRRRVATSWPVRMLASGLALIAVSMVSMNFDLAGRAWISAVIYLLGVFLAVAGGAATLARHRAS